MKGTLAMFVLMGAMFLPAVGDVVLVEDGQPKATIVVGTEPSPQAREAAAELQSYLHRITGADLPVVEEATDRSPRVLVGQAAAQEAAMDMGMEIPSGLTYRFDEEGYIVAADEDVLILAGNETEPYEGTYFAVYDFLESLGCRWFFPGEFGEVVPRMDTVLVKTTSRLMRPELRVRDTWYSGHLRVTSEQNQEFQLWKRRNRMSRADVWLSGVDPKARFLQNPGDDSTWRLLPKEKYWETHPQYYAMNPGGSRNERFICMSNPEALEAAAETIIENFQETGHYAFSFSPPDAPVLCHCPDCTRAMQGGFSGEGHGDVSDAYFPFVFKLADRVAEHFPDRWIITMAYYNRCRPPERVERKRDNVLIQLASIQQCSLHSYDQEGCWSRQEFRAMLERWAELTAGQVFYEYDPHDWRHLQRPVWRSRGIADDLRLLKRLGGWGFSNEGQMAWLSTGLNYYVRAKLAWNLEQSPGALVSDFCRNFFGPAAKPMHRYYTAIEGALRGSKIHFDGGPSADEVFTVLPRDLLDRCASWLEEAQRLAIAEPYNSRVAAFRGHFDRIDAAEKARADMARGDFLRAAHWGEAMVEAVHRVDNSLLLQDAGPWGGALSGTQMAENARKLLPWTDGSQGRLVAVLPPTASFRADPAMEGVTHRWYLPGSDPRGWRDLRMTSGWNNQGVKAAQGRPYEGIGWYRVELDLPQLPRGPVHLFIPELKGSAVWVWVNGRYAGSVSRPESDELTVNLSSRLQPGENLLAFRVQGNGGLSLPPFLFTPVENPEDRTELSVFPSEWLFRLDPQVKGESEDWSRIDLSTEGWQSMPVPSWWENTPVGAYDGEAWYRVRFTLPAVTRGKQLILHFGGVDEEAWVYLNGELVGEHTTASTGRTVHEIWDEPFDIPLLQARCGEENVLAVRVRDSMMMGGIFQPVRLYMLP